MPIVERETSVMEKILLEFEVRCLVGEGRYGYIENAEGGRMNCRRQESREETNEMKRLERENYKENFKEMGKKTIKIKRVLVFKGNRERG